MRPVALGRKNWLHIGSPRAGPKVAAILWVVERCRRLQVPVRDYVSTILPGLADLRIGAFQTLLPLCGSPDIHRLKQPGSCRPSLVLDTFFSWSSIHPAVPQSAGHRCAIFSSIIPRCRAMITACADRSRLAWKVLQKGSEPA